MSTLGVTLPATGHVLVLGGPGSGKSAMAASLVTQQVAAGTDPDRVLLLVPSRRHADDLRDRLDLPVPTHEPVVRTPMAVAFALLRAAAAAKEELSPVMLSGSEQDAIIAGLLAMHRAGEGAAVTWDSIDPAATDLAGFRAELRNLFMRASEFGLAPGELAELGALHGRPEWIAGAAAFEEYQQVCRLRSLTPGTPRRIDPAGSVSEAVSTYLEWDSPAPPPTFDLVVVDDYQEATAGTVRLLHALAARGARLVLLSDPDVAVQTFRGARPAFTGRAADPAGSKLGAFAASVHHLPGRVAGEVGAGYVRIVSHIPTTVGAAHRAPADGPGPSASASLYESAAALAHALAAQVRAAHAEGVALTEMAVITRTNDQARRLTRALQSQQIPVEDRTFDQALAAHSVVADLLTAVQVAGGLVDVGAVLADLATSFLGGLDPLTLRTLRRDLVRAHRKAHPEGPYPSGAELLAATAADPARAAGTPLAPLARILAAGRDVATRADRRGIAGDTLWAMWEASGAATRWQAEALAGDSRADAELDAVIALFGTVERLEERIGEIGIEQVVANLTGQAVASDVIIARPPLRGVTVTTPAGAAGRQWRHVTVAGLQEGVWPNLALRDSVLGAEALAEAILGRGAGDRRADILADELRLFASACTRATEHLHLAALSTTDDAPSSFIALVVPGELDLVTDLAVAGVGDVVAHARARFEAALAQGQPADEWASLLARLAADGFTAAAPDAWHTPHPASDPAGFVAPERSLRLSPSKTKAGIDCPLKFVLTSAGGTRSATLSAGVGTLVHSIAEHHPTGDLAAMTAELAERWGELELPDGWESVFQRSKVEAILAHLAADFAGRAKPLGVEVPFAFDLPGVTIAGTIDRIEDEGDVARVRDIKTSASPEAVPDSEVNPQLGIYQLAVNRGAVADVVGARRSSGGELIYPAAGKQGTIRLQPALPTDTVTFIEEQIAVLLAEVAAAVVPARPSDATCRFCDVESSCPAKSRGRQVRA